MRSNRAELWALAAGEFTTGVMVHPKPQVFVETIGFEPTTPWLQTRCSARLSYVPKRKVHCRTNRSNAESVSRSSKESPVTIRLSRGDIMPFVWNKEVVNYKADVFESTTLGYDISIRVDLADGDTVSVQFPPSAPASSTSVPTSTP